MSDSISDLIPALVSDPWRAAHPFDADLAAANAIMFDPASTAGDRERALSGWIQKRQPCLFGRLAAKLDLLSYCILLPEDLRGPDEGIRDKIQAARTEWTRQGFEGRKSGFVILAISPDVANATPGETTLRIARRLCSLYLLREIDTDVIYHDEIFLEKPGQARTTWKWDVGANYFCAQGDGRWWQDHRIPGGLALSMNSVGHMAKSGLLAKAVEEFDKAVGGPPETLTGTKVDSLEKALEFAMRTIALASDTPWGRATQLLPLPGDDAGSALPKCPVELPGPIAGMDHCTYQGYYHTDITIPSEYFIPDEGRPQDCPAHDLDFTYLFDKSIANPAFATMGSGQRVRSFQAAKRKDMRSRRMLAREEGIDSNERLANALRGA
jgi:hypothetical protein